MLYIWCGFKNIKPANAGFFLKKWNFFGCKISKMMVYSEKYFNEKIYMEYQIYNYIRRRLQFPLWLRILIAIILVPISLIPIILPIFPGSSVVGVVLLVISILFFVSWHKVRHVMKVRKGIVYMMQNLHRKRIIKQKMKDISSHIKQILDEREEKKKHK